MSRRETLAADCCLQSRPTILHNSRGHNSQSWEYNVNSVLESLVTALLGTLMAGKGNWQGGTAGGREGTAWDSGREVVGKGQCVICPAGRRDSLSCQTGVGVGVWRQERPLEKDLGWTLRNVQETPYGPPLQIHFHLDFPHQLGQGLLGLVSKGRLFSLTANF